MHTLRHSEIRVLYNLPKNKNKINFLHAVAIVSIAQKLFLERNVTVFIVISANITGFSSKQFCETDF